MADYLNSWDGSGNGLRTDYHSPDISSQASRESPSSQDGTQPQLTNSLRSKIKAKLRAGKPSVPDSDPSSFSIRSNVLRPAPSLTRSLSYTWQTSASGFKAVATKLGSTKLRQSHNEIYKVQQLLTPLEAPTDPNLGIHDAGNAKLTNEPIFALEMSPDGLYLAAGGQDKVVWVWTILTRSSESSQLDKSATYSSRFKLRSNRHSWGSTMGGAELTDKFGVFASRPICVFKGHTAGIVSLSWSANKFLITSSMDKTVRLWNVERNHCLGVFKHPDIPISIKFHPTDNRFFATGCLDKTLRLWSLPDKGVIYSRKHTSMITAVCFSPKGTVILAGSFSGHIYLHHTKELEEFDRMQVSTKLLNDRSSLKITGLTMFRVEHGGIERLKLLVTSNNSRVRVFDFETLSLDAKFKGANNKQSQTAAEISPDGNHVVCASEDGKVYLWDTEGPEFGGSDSLIGGKDNFQYEAWRVGNGGSATCATFAPTATKNLLFAYNDFIYRTAVSDYRGSVSNNDPDAVLRYRTAIDSSEIVIASNSRGQIYVYRQLPRKRIAIPDSDVEGSLWGLQGSSHANVV